MIERGSSYEGTPPPTLETGGSERRVALVIGNANYASDRDTLTNPHNDARGIAAALTRIGFTGVRANAQDDFTVDFSVPGVEPLLDLTNQRLGRALAAVTRVVSSASQAVVYYAGHGIELHGENYLIPIDARLAHIADAEYETQALSRALKAIQGASGLQLVILDACRNNPFRGRLFGTRDLGGGLRSIEPPGNVLVAYAAKHGTTAWDGEKGGNSPFATALLKYIETPGLEVIDLFREVKDEVLEATNLVQEPHLYGSVGRRREYFVLSQPVSTAEAAGRSAEQVAWSRSQWELLKNSADAPRLAAFAESATPFYAHEARERIASLDRAEQQTAKDEAERKSQADYQRSLAQQSVTSLSRARLAALAILILVGIGGYLISVFMMPTRIESVPTPSPPSRGGILDKL